MTLPDPLDRGLVIPRGRPRALPRVDVGGTEESGVPPRFRGDWRAGLDEGDGAGVSEVDFPRVLAVVPIDDPLGLLLPRAGADPASSGLVGGATWSCLSRSCL